MEENIYLNEILYLIDKNYYEKKINKDDLNKIELLISDLKNNNRSIKINFKKEIFEQYVYYNHLSKGEIIDVLIYDSNLKKLRESDELKIFDKKFTYSITQFVNFIKNKKDIKIHLIVIEIEIDKLELAFEIDSKYYTYSANTLNEIDNAIFKDYTSNFNKKLGEVLDKKLEELSGSKFKDNTRSILIDYATNFNQIIESVNNNEIENLILECGIVSKGMKYENRFTLMMHFVKKNGEILKNENRREYFFDTFCLNPPDQC